MDKKQKLQRVIGRLYSFLDEAERLRDALGLAPYANLPKAARNSPSSAYEELIKQLGERGMIPEFPENCTTLENVQSLIAELEAELG